MAAAATRAILAAFPAVLAACRRRDAGDPESGVRLSPHLAGLLEHLDPAKPVLAGELARLLRVTPATVSLQVATLVRLRLVTRTRGTTDARQVHLRLTEAGARVRDARSLLDPDRVAAALAHLPLRERRQAVAGARALARAAALLARPQTAVPTPSLSRKGSRR